MGFRKSVLEFIAGDITERSPQLHEAIADALGVGDQNEEITADGPIDEEDYSAMTWIVMGVFSIIAVYSMLAYQLPGAKALIGSVTALVGLFGSIGTLIAIAFTGLGISLLGVLLASKYPAIGYSCVWTGFVAGGLMLHLQLTMIGQYAGAIFTMGFIAPAIYGIGQAFKDGAVRICAQVSCFVILAYMASQSAVAITDKWLSMPTMIGQAFALLLFVLTIGFAMLSGRILAVCARSASPRVSPFTAAAYGLGVVAIVYWTQLIFMLLRFKQRD